MIRPVEDNQEGIIEEVVRQFVDARWHGREPDIDKFVEQYPGLEPQIRQAIHDAQRIDVLFDSLVRTDASDFLDEASGRDLIGQRVGNFEIVEMIGRGGMGVVYLARDPKLDRFVAIKSMPAELQSNSTARARLIQEAKLLASLSHPNIAVIHDIIEQDEGSAYLILEYISGETLAQRIVRQQLPLQDVLSIGQQVAEAVSAAHKKGVVHRDLKPGNIKITPDGTVKVLDFGLAKPSVSEDKKANINPTELGRVIGTPAYMSPEQARAKSVDHRTDIWSFGCVLYEMLTGHLPFEAQTATDTLARIIERDPDWKHLPERTPRNIRVLLRRCLEKNPDQRLDDITEAAKEINEALSKSQTSTAKLPIAAIIIGTVAVSIVLLGIALKYFPEKAIPPSSKETRLVVLPFENLGPAEDAYFAAGITDAITARLATIHGLAVISRQSAMQYKKGQKTARQIADDLQVDYILEGTVQRERPSDPNSRVRITPQLIKAADDAHVWVQTYDNDMSEVFHVQSDLAEQVAQGLNITLLEPERQALQSRPTENVEAYECYLRGNDYIDRSDLENYVRVAVQMYEKAVELDPSFALAYARLSEAHTLMCWFYYDRSRERLAMAKEAVDEALRLNPKLPEVSIALGWYYYQGYLDFDRALEHFTIARKSQPNNSKLFEGIAAVQRRQGKLREALANFERALSLDPLSKPLYAGVGETLLLLRNYSEAERYFEHCISITPDWPEPYYYKALICLLSEGSIDKTRAVLKDALPKIGSVEDPYFIRICVLVNVFDAKYQEALVQLSTGTSEILESQFFFIPKSLLYAQIYGFMGNRELQEKYNKSAQNTLESKIQEDPNDARFHSSLGIAYAGLSRKDDAIREGKLATELLPITKDAWIGSWRLEDLARIYAMVGEYDLATEQLEYLLSIPSELSAHLLQIDPAWDHLRNHPRFKKLLESGK